MSIDERQIVEFATSYDPQPIHTDPDAAGRGPYGGVIASGWQTCVLTMQRFVPGFLSPASSLGSPAIDELRFPLPVRPGDRLTVRGTVLDARASASRPDRGIVRTKIETHNADGDLVLSMIVVNFDGARHSRICQPARPGHRAHEESKPATPTATSS